MRKEWRGRGRRTMMEEGRNRKRNEEGMTRMKEAEEDEEEG